MIVPWLIILATPMTVIDTLRHGLEILDPIMRANGFAFREGASGASSGGEFASGTYVRGDRSLEIHFRGQLGLVTYHIGADTLSHEAFMRVILGAGNQSRYPGFSDDPLAAFSDLRSDLENHAADFLSGDGSIFRRCVQEARAAQKAESAGANGTRMAKLDSGDAMKKPKETKRSSDEAVKAKTGKAWAEWFAILDQAGAKKMPHKEILAYLHDKQGVTSWWCQMVAVAYEHERGLRQMFQKCDGAFSASASRTIAAPLAKAFEGWTNDKLRRRWLPDAPMEITTATPGKYVRAKWDEGTRLSVGFYSTPGGKTRVAVDHEKLASSKECEKMKSYWWEALGRLQETLEA